MVWPLMLVMLLMCARCGLTPVPPPGDNATVDIEQALANRDSVIAPTTGEVLMVIFRFPAGADRSGELDIEPQLSGTLPKVGLISKPERALNSDGLYIAVRDDSGEFVNLLLLSDPRVIRSEEEIGGRLVPDRIRVPDGVIAARVPFEPDGNLQLFETAGGRVTRVYVDMPLGGAPFPRRGRRGAVLP
jgi:hypothetical protein